ncbi:MAG: sigma-70 family RNA polymerase sigma factor [Planctomycetota bacterium]
MTEVTQLLQQVAGGDSKAADQLLPLIYHELRRVAHARLRGEANGLTLQATDLVHEAYLRLVRPGRGHPADQGSDEDQNRSPDADVESSTAAAGDLSKWNSRGHFFGAAAQAMRRILVESARRKKSQRHGGNWERIRLSHCDPPASHPTGDSVDILDLDDALNALAETDPQAAKIVELRYFASMTVDEAAATLGVSPRTVKRDWSYAKAWLRRKLQ